MSEVVGKFLEGLVLKSAPKAHTLEASLDAYTKPNLIELAESNNFEVRQSWNKDQIIEVISEGLRSSLEERFSKFEIEQLQALQEMLDGNTNQINTQTEIVSSAVNKGLLYVSTNAGEVTLTMPDEMKEKLAAVIDNNKQVKVEEKPADEVAKKSIKTVPFSSRRRQRIQPVQQRIVGKKVGRNEPCPCGSGKKYKKCCWRKDQRTTVNA